MAIKINRQEKTIEIKCVVADNPVVFNYFNNLSEESREELLIKAIHIGVLALEEDRISAFLAKTKTQLSCELASLSERYESNAKIRDIQEKTAIKGQIAENDIANVLADYVSTRGWDDDISQTGNTSGKISKNKTGDIVCTIPDSEKRIVVECKLNKSVSLGEIGAITPVRNSKANDTAWSQLIEADANRDGVPIIVFDRKSVHSSVSKSCRNVTFVKGVGFIVIIDSELDNYVNLLIAYDLARDIASHPCSFDINVDCLNFLIQGLVRDITSILDIESIVKTNFQQNFDNTKRILEKIKESQMLLELNKKYLQKFLETGNLSKLDLLHFYQGDDNFELLSSVKSQIEKELSSCTI